MKRQLAVVRSDVVSRVAGRLPGFSRADVDISVKLILAGMAEALVAGRRIELRGFGAFGLKWRPPRTGRNPLTEARVHVPGKWRPYFKPGLELRTLVRSSAVWEGQCQCSTE